MKTDYLISKLVLQTQADVGRMLKTVDWRPNGLFVDESASDSAEVQHPCDLNLGVRTVGTLPFTARLFE